MRPNPRWLPLLFVLGSTPSVGAQDDPLAAIRDHDPVELARAIDHVGDDWVVERLGEDRPRDARLTAVRASPHLHAPELALPALVELARGRDPWLAAAAMQSVLPIAERLTFADLSRREADLDALRPAAEGLDALAQDETARADLRAAASLARDQLRSGALPTPSEAPGR